MSSGSINCTVLAACTAKESLDPSAIAVDNTVPNTRKIIFREVGAIFREVKATFPVVGIVFRKVNATFPMVGAIFPVVEAAFQVVKVAFLMVEAVFR